MAASVQSFGHDGRLLAETDFSYKDNSSTAMQQLGIHEPLRASEAMSMYTAGTKNYTIETGYAYDAYGNVTIESDFGDVSTPDDDISTATFSSTRK